MIDLSKLTAPEWVMIETQADQFFGSLAGRILMERLERLRINNPGVSQVITPENIYQANHDLGAADMLREFHGEQLGLREIIAQYKPKAK